MSELIPVLGTSFVRPVGRGSPCFLPAHRSFRTTFLTPNGRRHATTCDDREDTRRRGRCRRRASRECSGQSQLHPTRLMDRV